MFWTYLRRELSGRKKQSIIIASGLAIAIAATIIVNSLALGVRNAQSDALTAIYGIGTDITVQGEQSQPDRNNRFEFGNGAGSTEGGTVSINQSRLSGDMLRSNLDETVIDQLSGIDGISNAVGALSLTNTTFSGEMPDFSTWQQGSGQQGSGERPTQGQQPSGGFDGQGGSAFNLDSFSVLGVDTNQLGIGPLSAATLSSGRALTSEDVDANVAMLDETYANSVTKTVGDTIEVGGAEFEVVGLVSTSEANAAADVFIPLVRAQELSDSVGKVSIIYVQAESAKSISSVQEAIETLLPTATVNTQAELASTVTGSLSQVSSLLTKLGTWLSVILLALAIGLSALLTASSIGRRTRELGTLKAIGWSDGRIVRQVGAESLVQGLFGGLLGVTLGLVGIGIVNWISPTVGGASATTTQGQGDFGNMPGGGMTGPMQGGFPGGNGDLVQAASEVVLHAPISLTLIAMAVGLAVVAGLISGMAGGWRASRLAPAEALRAIN